MVLRCHIMNIPLIKDLLSWVIDHADFTFPYASSVPVRALIFLLATLCFFVIVHFIEKWSRKKKNAYNGCLKSCYKRFFID